MIERTNVAEIKVILPTPSRNLAVDLSKTDNVLEKLAQQIQGIPDSYLAVKQLLDTDDGIAAYMSQSSHPNVNVHRLIAREILKYF